MKILIAVIVIEFGQLFSDMALSNGKRPVGLLVEMTIFFLIFKIWFKNH